jgi:alpha,alpha-trehalase
MAGTIDLIQRCYLGLELRANVLYFDPVLPDELARINVHVRYRRQVLAVEVTHEVLRIRSTSFTVAPITIAYRGHFRDVAPGDTCEFRLLTPQERNRDENRPAGVPR